MTTSTDEAAEMVAACGELTHAIAALRAREEG